MYLPTKNNTTPTDPITAWSANALHTAVDSAVAGNALSKNLYHWKKDGASKQEPTMDILKALP